MRNIAIIPARSGSKGLKDKNIKILCGKPLMAWTIEAALNSQKFDEVMVSTDSEKYKKIALEYGANVPFLRSKENSEDKSSSWDVMREVINLYADKSIQFDTICMLQPTSPLRTLNDIKNAYKMYEDNNADSVVSVCELDHSINICNKLPEDFSMNGFYDSTKSGRRQDAEKYYRINGAIYIQKMSDLLNKKNIYGEKSYAYIMDKEHSVDIDDEMDFVFAQTLMQRYMV